MKWIALVVLLSLAPACGASRTPPNLSPVAQIAWNGKKVIVALDTFQTVVIAANAQTPPLISTDVTREIVTYVRDAALVIQAAPDGWEMSIERGFEALLRRLPPDTAQMLSLYISLVRGVIREVLQ